MMNKLQIIGAFVIAFCSVSLLNAQDATITVKPSEDAPTISKHIYGHFAEHLGRSIFDGFFVGKDSPIPNTDGVRNDLIEALESPPISFDSPSEPFMPIDDKKLKDLNTKLDQRIKHSSTMDNENPPS